MDVDLYGRPLIPYSEKPHHGRIANWFRYGPGKHYCIRGEFLDHPLFAGDRGQTSYIVSHDELTGEVETRNSRYTLVGSELKPFAEVKPPLARSMTP